MAGLKIVIPTSFTGTGLPTLINDPILAKGSLVLTDTTHPAGKWPAGVPANGAELPNVAASELAALTRRNATDSAISATYQAGTGWVNGTTNSVTRTPKGGLLGRIIPGTSLAANAWAALNIPQASLDYILANQNNAYYISSWAKISVAESSGYPGYAFIGANAGSNGPRLFGWQVSDRPFAASPKRLGGHSDDYNTTGAKFRYTAVQRPSVNEAADADTVLDSTTRGVFGFGNLASPWPSAAGWPTYAIYRVYVEDLTVSGRTHAEVQAIDRALYTKEVLTTGGRYFNDTVAG